MRLLVAEDNLNNQQVARELLEHEGAIVRIANHGQEAVEAVAHADPQFDVVLMDVQMPRMGGIEATRAIRASTVNGASTVPILAMTAHALDTDREECLQAGMNGYISKPVRAEDLYRAIESVLDKIRLPEAS